MNNIIVLNSDEYLYNLLNKCLPLVAIIKLKENE